MNSNTKNPKVSVIMPVWNTEKYIRQALQSLIDQTFTDFEVIIINDGSTDKSLEIIESFNDPRIRIFNREKKTSIVDARNFGLKMSQGEYIAPLDSDDIAYKDRLALEVAFLDNHPDAGIVSGNILVIDKDGNPTGAIWKEHIPSEKIPVRLLFGNCFAQSSVMIRKTAIPTSGYTESTSEDFDLWVKILKKWKAYNIGKMVLKYRTHVENTTTRLRVPLYDAVKQVLLIQIAELGLEPTSDELEIHRESYTLVGTTEEIKKQIDRREMWLLKMLEANKKSKRYPEKVFNEVMAERFLTTLETNAVIGSFIIQKLVRSPLTQYLTIHDMLIIIPKLFIKLLLKRNSLNIMSTLHSIFK